MRLSVWILTWRWVWAGPRGGSSPGWHCPRCWRWSGSAQPGTRAADLKYLLIISHISFHIIHFISKIPSIVQFQGKLRAQFKFCKSYGSLWSKKEQNSWQIQFLILSPRLFNVWESIQYACLRALLEQCSFLHLSEDALRALLSSVHLFESLQCLWPF